MRFQVTEAATAMPSGEPKTFDMQEMVDHMARMGLIKSKPAVYLLRGAFGAETMVIHPDLHAKLAEKVALTR